MKIDFILNQQGLLLYKNRLYMPNIREIKFTVMDELHKIPYSGHLGYHKMITIIRKYFFWTNMKKEVVEYLVVEYLAHCLECQQVKVEHQHPVGLLQPLPILEWKWDTISMDFITGLPKNFRQHDSIMVVVENLSKAAHFIPDKSTYKDVNIADIFMKEIFRLHVIPKVILSDRDAKFTGNF